MLRQRWRRLRKVGYGLVGTYVRSAPKYDAASWWDDTFYGPDGKLEDAVTIGPDHSPVQAAYHYRSIEQLLLADLTNRRFDPTGLVVLDVGSGAGHWVDFWLSMGVGRVVACDVSRRAIDTLKRRYDGSPRVQVEPGSAREVCDLLEAKSVDIVCAVGVMFHIVDDIEWQDTVLALGRVTCAGGLLVATGLFQRVLPSVNHRWRRGPEVSKRWRPRSQWKRALIAAGFERPSFHVDRAWLHVDSVTVEANLCVAARGSDLP